MAFNYIGTILLFFFGVVFTLVYLALPSNVAGNDILGLLFLFAPILLFSVAIVTAWRG